MISANEVYSVVPIAFLSIVYWVRDIYTFNRAHQPWYTFSRTQMRVLMLYPAWVFLSWTSYIATARSNVPVLMLTTTARTFVSFFSTVGILNDSFRFTDQQCLGFFIQLFINYVWNVTSLLVYGGDE